MGGNQWGKYTDMKVMDVNDIQNVCKLIKQSTETLGS